MKHALLFLLLVPVTFTYRYIDASIAGRVPHYTSASESERVPLHTTAAAFGQEQLQAAAAASEKVRLSFASPAPGREQLLEGALLNRYLELIGSTLQRPFGCGKIMRHQAFGRPQTPGLRGSHRSRYIRRGIWTAPVWSRLPNRTGSSGPRKPDRN